MKKPYELENEVMQKYLSISEERGKEFLTELEKKINESSIEYYLFKKITIGEDLLLDIEDRHLTIQDRYNNKKDLIKQAIKHMTHSYVKEKLKDAGWVITRPNTIYYLERWEREN